MELSVSVGSWDVFILVLIRVAAMVMVAPVLGARPIPTQVKVGLSVVLAILLTPLQSVAAPLFTDWMAVFTSVTREVVIGLLLGFAGTIIFSAVQMAAQVIGVQMGLTFANTMDPLSGQNAGAFESLYGWMALVIFMNLGGHHALIAALGQSFELAPLGGAGPNPIVGDRLVALSSAAMAIALRLALPMAGTMLLVDSAMALVVRSIPQMNIFAVGLPVKMVIGFLALVGLTPMMANGVDSLTRNVAAAVGGILR